MGVEQRGNRFHVRVYDGPKNKRIWVGTYETREEADLALETAKTAIHGDDAHRRSAVMLRLRNASDVSKKRRKTRPKPKHATVYRAYDRDGAILYVGYTSTAFSRFFRHSQDASWWGQVDRLELEHFPDTEAALERERELIRSLNPPHNTIHRKKKVEHGTVVRLSTIRNRASRAATREAQRG